MSFFSRIAVAVAMTFSLAGLVANSTPGFAAELDRGSFPTAAATHVPMPVTAEPTALPTQPAVDDAIDTSEIDTSEDVAVYPTLAAAVAAQDFAEADEAAHCLASAIYHESKGEPLAGQLAVAQVVINRLKSGRFPTDVCSVITQRGQFGFVRGGRLPAVDASRSAYRTAIAVAKVALADAWNGPVPRALFFNTPDRRPGSGLTKIASIGNHVFYR